MAIKPYTLNDFLAEMDGYHERIPLDYLTERLESLEISYADIQRFAQFGRDTYQRTLIHAGPAYSAFILCWRPGQRSPIHDHAGSSCGVKVIRGEAIETYFDRTPDGHVYAVSSRTLSEGGVCGSQDADMHQVSNLQAVGRDLITLHVYSPPLVKMGIYSLYDTRVGLFADPIVSLCDGDGI